MVIGRHRLHGGSPAKSVRGSRKYSTFLGRANARDMWPSRRRHGRADAHEEEPVVGRVSFEVCLFHLCNRWQWCPCREFTPAACSAATDYRARSSSAPETVADSQVMSSPRKDGPPKGARAIKLQHREIAPHPSGLRNQRAGRSAFVRLMEHRNLRRARQYLLGYSFWRQAGCPKICRSLPAFGLPPHPPAQLVPRLILLYCFD